MVELADFSNELCDIVVNSPESQRQSAITNLLVRHKNLISLDQDQLAEVLEQVRQSFEQRYASLVGIDVKASRFSRNIATMASGGALREIPDRTQSRLQVSEGLIEQARAANAQTAPVAVRVQPAKPKPQAQRIQLAKVAVDVEGIAPKNARSQAVDTSEVDEAFKGQVAELARKLSAEGRDERLLNRMLKLWAEQLMVSKWLILKANSQKNELVVAGGLHAELDALMKEFKVPISPAKVSSDVFSQAFFQNKDIVVEDTYSAKASTMVPVRYYEVIGAPTTALYPCVCKGHGTVILLVEAESPDQLPTSNGIRRTAELRPLFACALS